MVFGRSGVGRRHVRAFFGGPGGSGTGEVAPLWLSSLDADLVDRGRAWAKVAAGEVSAGGAVLREAADRAAAQDNFVAEARLLHDVARLGDSASVARRLAQLSEVVDGEMVHLFARHANAVARVTDRPRGSRRAVRRSGRVAGWGRGLLRGVGRLSTGRFAA